MDAILGGVAQLGERTVRIRKVESSILFVSTKNPQDYVILRIFCNLFQKYGTYENIYHCVNGRNAWVSF